MWAYDELQNLGEYTMASPEDLFGRDHRGEPFVQLRNEEGRPPQDIVLPVCYRNTPWALTVAHGLGFGMYRQTTEKAASPLVQIFDEPSLWSEIGYEVTSGELRLGSNVALKRKAECSPPFFADPTQQLVSPEEAVVFVTFDDKREQAAWIAGQVQANLEEGELLYRDILIILPDAYTSKSQYALIFEALRERNIASHLVGVGSSRDKVFNDNSIAVTHIHRAKGNEAAMVYVVNSHECHSGLELAKKRNILFTAITRSRAWVRVCGVGPASAALQSEFEAIRDHEYRLEFDYPTSEQISRMRRIHRDRSEEEQKKLNSKVSGFSEVIELINRGELSSDALPSEFLIELRKLLPRD